MVDFLIVIAVTFQTLKADIGRSRRFPKGVVTLSAYFRFLRCYNSIRYMKNCDYDDLLTSYSATGLRKNNNKIRCLRAPYPFD